MKTPSFIFLLALLASAALAADPAPAKPAANASADITGKATVTIEVNGQKVTREIDLGKTTQLDIGSGVSYKVTTGKDGVTIDAVPTGANVVTGKGDLAKAKAPAEVRTWLGVVSDEPSADARLQLPIPNGTGLLIRDVFADSPAAKAGLEKNDILVRLDDQILTNPEQLRVLTSSKKDGDTVHVTYLRKGHEATVEARLASHAEEEPAGKNFDWIITSGWKFLNAATSTGSSSTSSGSTSGSTATPLVLSYNTAVDKDGNLAFSAVPGAAGAGQDGARNSGENVPEKAKTPAEVRPWLGVVTDEPSDDVRAQLSIPNGTGLLVRSVIGDSPAAKAGLEKNDVLVRLNDQILANTEQLGALIRTKKEGDTVRLAYLRKGREASAEAKLETHAEEDAGNAVSSYATWILKRLQKGLKTEGDGKVLILRDAPGTAKDKAAGNAQWSLFTEGLLTDSVQANVTEQIKKLDKTLRDAGLNEEAVAQTNKTIAEAVAQVQKALSNATVEKAEIQANLVEALVKMKGAEEEAARKAQPAPPAQAAPPAEKAR